MSGQTSFPSVAITDSTVSGRGLLTAADAPAQRSLLGVYSSSETDSAIASAVAGFSDTSLSNLSSAATARTNLGLGSSDSPTFDGLELDGSSGSSELCLKTETGEAYVSFIDDDFIDLAWSVGIDAADSNKFKISKSAFKGLDTGNVFSIDTSDNATFAGDVTATSFIGDGSQLTGIAAGSVEPLHLSTNRVEQRNGTNSQEHFIYHTYTDDDDYERAAFIWDSFKFCIKTQGGSSGGTKRHLDIDAAATNIYGNMNFQGVEFTGGSPGVLSGLHGILGFGSGANFDLQAKGSADLLLMTGASSSSSGTVRVRVKSDGSIILSGVPTSDPSTSGQIWNDSGTLKISA